MDGCSSSLEALRKLLETSGKHYTDDALTELLNRSDGNVNAAANSAGLQSTPEALLQCSSSSSSSVEKLKRLSSSDEEGPLCKKQKPSFESTNAPSCSTVNVPQSMCSKTCVKCLVHKQFQSPSLSAGSLPLRECRVMGRLYSSPGIAVPSKVEPSTALDFPIRIGSFVLEVPEERIPHIKFSRKTECYIRWEPLEMLVLRLHTCNTTHKSSDEEEIQLPSAQLEKQGFPRQFIENLWQLYHKGILHFSPQLLWATGTKFSKGKAVVGVKISVEILQEFEIYDEKDGETYKRSKAASVGLILTGLMHYGQGLVYGPDSDCLLNWLSHDKEQWICRRILVQNMRSKRKLSRNKCKKNLQLRAKGSRLKAKRKSVFVSEEVLKLNTSRMLLHGKDDETQICGSFDVLKVFEEVSSVDMPLAELPCGVISQAKSYQLQALAWMKRREDATVESCKSVKKKPIFLHPCWMQLITEDGQVIYVNRVNGSISLNFYPAPSSTTCGGLLCDEMGLGKTLEILMLIMANPPPQGWAETRRSSQMSKATVDGKPRREIGAVNTTSTDVVAIKATLIVVPSTILNQWQQEISIHIEPGKLKWAVYKGYEAIAWHTLDIVFTSYEVLRKLVTSGVSPLVEYGFWRIVLDEAQLVANSNSVAALMASSIHRRHAWVVTGTPVTARLEELQGLLDFLAVEPFGEPSIWHAMFQGPFGRHEKSGLQRLRLLLGSIMLRRTKQQVEKEMNVPSCTKEDIFVTLSGTEGSNYDYCYKEFAQTVETLKRKRARHANNVSSKVTGRMLAALTRLRQSCCHPQIMKKESGFLGNLRLTMEEIMQKLVVKAKMEYDGATKEWIQSKIALATVSSGSRTKDELRHLVREIQCYKAATNQRYGSLFNDKLQNDMEQKVRKQMRMWSRLELCAWTAYASMEDDKSDDTARAILRLKEELGVAESKLMIRPQADRAAKKKAIGGVSCQKKSRAKESIVNEIERSRASMEKFLHKEKHVEEKWMQMWKGKEKKEDEDGGGCGATTCPICFESFVDNSSVTVCGHYFCSHCIQEVVEARDQSSKCPICRTPLQQCDIFSVCLHSQQDPPPQLNGEYGAKISALLSELILLGERDPNAKSIIFSSWTRLLNIVSAALSENDMPHTYLTGTEQKREEAIRRFNTDPKMRCILVIMATGGGASGLTMVEASTVFILEPSVNAGLEAQAAARVHRLTQTNSTRIIRLIAKGTIEEKIVALQHKKMTGGAAAFVNPDEVLDLI